MNDWEQHANLSLQSLGEAYQRGHIDRGEFRARRRRILQGIRERHAQTQPNALHAAPPSPLPPSQGPAQMTAPRAAGTAEPRTQPRTRTGTVAGALMAAATCAIIAAGLIAWWWLRRGG